MIASVTDGATLEVLLIEDRRGDVRLMKEACCDSENFIHLHVGCDDAFEGVTREFSDFRSTRTERRGNQS